MSSSNNFSCYVNEINSNYQASQRFQTTRTQKTFVFENMDTCSDPVETLRELCKEFINKAIISAKNQGLEPDNLGVSISSVLLNPDIHYPIRPINNNIADILINMFQRVSQGSIYGEPFTLTITTINKSGLPKQRRTFGRGN